jgi:hypothetical protein
VQILLEVHYFAMTRDVERFVDEIRALNPNPYGDFLRLHLGLEAIYLAGAADARMRGFFEEIRAVVAQSDQSIKERLLRIGEIMLKARPDGEAAW